MITLSNAGNEESLNILMEDVLQVVEISDSPENHHGLEILIEGIFIMERGVGYLCKDIDDIGRKSNSVLVSVKDLEATLLSCVPAYAGSKYSYCDRAEISGRLFPCDVDGFKWLISDIASFFIYKYDDVISVDM